MTGIEAATLAVGKVVAKRAGQEWLAARSRPEGPRQGPTELIRVSFLDRFIQRSLTRQLEAIADTVEQRLSPLIEQEYRGLDDNDRVAVLAEVVVALEQTDLSDKALFAVTPTR